jgi:RNA polymerase sigma-70 factor, ECF subfamily
MMNPDDASRTEFLVRLLTEHQQPVFRYIFSLVPNEADARDILQDTSVALTRKFDQYDSSKPFLAWAYRFAYLEILKFREKNQRRPTAMADDVLELLADQRSRIEPALNERLMALTDCLSKLPSADRQVVTYRYDGQHSIEQILERVSMSRRTLFRNLERIRRNLAECIQRAVTAEVAS